MCSSTQLLDKSISDSSTTLQPEDLLVVIENIERIEGDAHVEEE